MTEDQGGQDPAFLAVPVAALIAVVYRYARDALDGRHPEVADDGSQLQLVGDAQQTELVRRTSDGAPAADRMD